jgi:hypothetical protein
MSSKKIRGILPTNCKVIFMGNCTVVLYMKQEKPSVKLYLEKIINQCLSRGRYSGKMSFLTRDP